MAQRIFEIKTVDLDSVPFLEVDSVRADTMPSRDIAAFNLAWQDGKTVVQSFYRNKKVYGFAHIAAGTLEQYEQARDTLLGLLHENVAYTITIEQAGGFRRYYCIHESTSFDYKGNGFALVTLTFDCTLPFGEEPTLTTAFNETGVTQPYNATFASLGSIYTPARISVTINAIDPDDEERVFTFLNETSGKSYELEVSKVWSVNDTILVDGNAQKVFVNNNAYPYSGRFPILYRTNQLQILDTADTRNLDIMVQYNRRFL